MNIDMLIRDRDILEDVVADVRKTLRTLPNLKYLQIETYLGRF